MARDITEHTKEREYQGLLNKILLALSRSDESTAWAHRILLLIQSFTGIETVGIRLEKGGDYPYCATEGFPEDFVGAEGRLCVREGETGGHGEAGTPYLECLCGDVICGRTNPSLPFFTAAGSFWSNDIAKPLDSIPERDRQPFTRNGCHDEGYRSVALIPLKSREGTVGLIQLNDKRPDRFTREMVRFLEGIGTSVGILIVHKNTEERARRNEGNLRRIIEHNVDSMLVVDKEGEIRFVNPAAEAFFCSSEAGLLGAPFGLPMIGSGREEISIVRPSGSGTAFAEMDMVEVEWEGEPSYLVSLHDVTDRKRAERELNAALGKLRKTLNGTIQAMSLMVESRDPYTAGHQRRVSRLARSIAQELGLPENTVENIRIAGIVHDIGKVSIPAEILSKPAKLTDVEYRLIKDHPQAGYDILKEVALPSPIAEIVLQHHERMDGSGYPRNLKGDEILMEARILGVCDVVEAMASHRPYRATLGIDAALREIEDNRGILYDADVVGACARLFRAKGFRFTDN